MSSTNHYRKFFKSYTESYIKWSEIEKLCGGRYERSTIFIEKDGNRIKIGDEYQWKKYQDQIEEETETENTKQK